MAKSESKPMQGTTVFTALAAVSPDSSKNYAKCAPYTDPVPNPMPFLMGRDGKLYVEKSITPTGTKQFRITIEALP